MKSTYKFILTWIIAAIAIAGLLYAIIYHAAHTDAQIQFENVKQELLFGSVFFGLGIGFFVALGPSPTIKFQRQK